MIIFNRLSHVLEGYILFQALLCLLSLLPGLYKVSSFDLLCPSPMVFCLTMAQLADHGLTTFETMNQNKSSF
jgi:hypothetical protein